MAKLEDLKARVEAGLQYEELQRSMQLRLMFLLSVVEAEQEKLRATALKAEQRIVDTKKALEEMLEAHMQDRGDD